MQYVHRLVPTAETVQVPLTWPDTDSTFDVAGVRLLAPAVVGTVSGHRSASGANPVNPATASRCGATARCRLRRRVAGARHSDLSTTASSYGHYDFSDLERAMEPLARTRREDEEPTD